MYCKSCTTTWWDLSHSGVLLCRNATIGWKRHSTRTGNWNLTDLNISKVTPDKPKLWRHNYCCTPLNSSIILDLFLEMRSRFHGEFELFVFVYESILPFVVRFWTSWSRCVSKNKNMKVMMWMMIVKYEVHLNSPRGAIHTKVTTQSVKLTLHLWPTHPPKITSSLVLYI